MDNALAIRCFRLESDDYGVPRGSHGYVDEDYGDTVAMRWLPPAYGGSVPVAKDALEEVGELLIPIRMFTAAARHFAAVRCKICGMGSIEGCSWLRSHTCPEPFPKAIAQSMWNSMTVPGSIVHPETRARLAMSWRCGYVKATE